MPVSEIAILIGAVGVLFGWLDGSAAPLVAGVVVCTLGVLEFTAREHFSGYRSHALLLAALTAAAVAAGLAFALGNVHERALLLVSVLPVFGLVFWVLRKRFHVARQARVRALTRD